MPSRSYRVARLNRPGPEIIFTGSFVVAVMSDQPCVFEKPEKKKWAAAAATPPSAHTFSSLQPSFSHPSFFPSHKRLSHLGDQYVVSSIPLFIPSSPPTPYMRVSSRSRKCELFRIYLLPWVNSLVIPRPAPQCHVVSSQAVSFIHILMFRTTLRWVEEALS